MQLTYVRSDKAAQSRVGDETVLLHIENGVYFGLDRVGTRVWELLEAASTSQEICELMVKEFEVSHEQLNVDIQAFLKELLDAELVVISNK